MVCPSTVECINPNTRTKKWKAQHMGAQKVENDEVRPAYVTLFPNNEHKFIKNSKTQGILDYASIHKKEILIIANEWGKHSCKEMKTIPR